MYGPTLRCKWCGRRTPLNQEGAWYDPGGPFAESDEYCEPSITCAPCAQNELDFIASHEAEMEAEMMERAERSEEWERIAKWADACGL